MARCPDMKRTFLAVPLADLFSREITPFLETIKKMDNAVKWVKPSEVHVTLHFFGSTPEDKLPQIAHCVHSATTGFPSLVVSLSGLGFFPNLNAAGVIWLGVKTEGEQLEKLQNTVEGKLGEAGFALEERKFHPHATLGRVRQGSHLSPQFTQMNFPESGQKIVDHIVLFESQLGPSGARYEILERFDLSQK